VSDCEELVGVTHRRWWDWFKGVILKKNLTYMFILMWRNI